MCVHRKCNQTQIVYDKKDGNFRFERFIALTDTKRMQMGKVELFYRNLRRKGGRYGNVAKLLIDLLIVRIVVLLRPLVEAIRCGHMQWRLFIVIRVSFDGLRLGVIVITAVLIEASRRECMHLGGWNL